MVNTNHMFFVTTRASCNANVSTIYKALEKAGLEANVIPLQNEPHELKKQHKPYNQRTLG